MRKAFQARRLAALHAKKEAELQQSLAAGREVELGLAGSGSGRDENIIESSPQALAREKTNLNGEKERKKMPLKWTHVENFWQWMFLLSVCYHLSYTLRITTSKSRTFETFCDRFHLEHHHFRITHSTLPDRH